MLNDAEQAGLDEAAADGNSGYAIELMRYLARQQRIDDLARVIDRYHQRVEINKAPVRRFLAHQVPGILSNHFFPSLGETHFQRFIAWSVSSADWARPLVDAADACDPDELARAVGAIVASLPV